MDNNKRNPVLKFLPVFGILILAFIFNITNSRSPNIITGIGLACTVIAGTNLLYWWVIPKFIQQPNRIPLILTSIYILITIGAIFNGIALASNGGYMPVRPDLYLKYENLISPMYISGGNLTILGDYYFHGMSLGDMFLYSTLALLIIWLPLNFISSKIKTKQGEQCENKKQP